MQNNRKNVLLAVAVKPNVKLLNTGLPLYFHVYSNDWLSLTTEGRAIAEPVKETSGYVADLNVASNVINTYRNSTVGNTYLHHNGYLVNDISMSEVSLGDNIACLNDKSGRGYFDVTLSSLKHYTSTLDARGKIIVQVPERTVGDRLYCEPVDEVEIYVCSEQAAVGGQYRMKGFYYSRIQPKDTRMLTHRDFALDSQRLDALIAEHIAFGLEMDDVFLRVFLRNHTAGYKTFVDGDYLNDMFKLDIANRANLLTEVSGTYYGWRPELLEVSPYNKWQQASISELGIGTLKGVYSLDELNIRARVGEFNNTHLKLPYCMVLGGKVLGFDVNGAMIEIIDVPSNSAYETIVVSPDIVKVECIPGTFTETGELMDRDVDFVDQADWFDEKFYFRTIEDTQWHEAVEGTDYVIDTTHSTVVWDNLHNTDGRMRRSIRDAIYRNFKVEPEMLYHPLPIYASPGPVTLLRLTRLDVYINGRKGIEGLDYIVDYPNITITNKQYYMNETGLVDIDVFHYGVPGESNSRAGFLQRRVLADTDLDLFVGNRDVSVCIDGYRAEYGELGLPENPGTTTNTKYREGAPYQIEHRPNILGPLARKKLAYGYPDISALASTAVSNLLPVPNTSTPVFIPHGHAIYSPFIKKLIVMLRSNEIDVSIHGLSDMGVATTMAPYMDEIDSDLIGLPLITDMVDIHPTSNVVQVDVTEEEFMFLRKVSKLYYENRIVFNTYLNIQEGIEPQT
jgi:hypothetical protein